MADGEEDEEISRNQQSLKEWEQIHPSSSLLLLNHSSSSSVSSAAQAHDQAQVHLRGWEMVVNRNRDREEKNNSYNDDCYIFPPSNHEGLHIPSQQQLDEVHNHHHHEEREDEIEERQSSSSTAAPPPPPDPLDSRLRVAGEVLMKRLDSGFEVLWSKFIRIGSWVRSYASGGRVGWSFASPATGFGIAFLVSLLYLRWQQQRRRRRRLAQQEMKDRLIFLIERTDEKLSQLLDKIAQMNEALSARRRVPVLHSG